MAFCSGLVRKRLHWTLAGEEFILREGTNELCRMNLDPVRVECVFGGKGLNIRRKGLIKPRIEISSDDASFATIRELNAFEPQLVFDDGTVYVIKYLNSSNTSLAFFNGDANNVMEVTDISTWSEPRTELVVNRAVDDHHARALMAVGHFLLLHGCSLMA